MLGRLLCQEEWNLGSVSSQLCDLGSCLNSESLRFLLIREMMTETVTMRADIYSFVFGWQYHSVSPNSTDVLSMKWGDICKAFSIRPVQSKLSIYITCFFWTDRITGAMVEYQT